MILQLTFSQDHVERRRHISFTAVLMKAGLPVIKTSFKSFPIKIKVGQQVATFTLLVA